MKEEKKIKPSATAYFAIFMSSLDREKESSEEMEDEEDEMESMEAKESSSTRDERTKSATLNLLASIFPKVPQAVIKSKINEIGTLFLKLYQNYSNSKSPNFIKAVSRTYSVGFNVFYLLFDCESLRFLLFLLIFVGFCIIFLTILYS